MKSSSWGTKALYAMFVIFFLEASLQIYYHATTSTYLFLRNRPPIFASDPISGWTNTPNLSYRHVTPEFAADIYTNKHGFRVSSAHEEYERTKDDNVFRILLLGPSFAYGWGVSYEHTFAVQLERRLATAHFARGARIEVLNHGVPYQPPANSFHWFTNAGRAYSPDLVIQFVYGSLEVSGHPDDSVQVINGRAIHKNAGTKESLWAYAKKSATVFYSGVLLGLAFKAVDERPLASIDGAGREMRNTTTFSPDDDSIKGSLSLYKNFNDVVEGSGAEFTIVFFPLAYVVHPEDALRWWLHGVEDIDRQKEFNRAFERYLNDLGIRCLNLTEDLIQIAKEEKSRLYFWLDIHWNEKGNAVAARLVSEHLNHQNTSLTAPAHITETRSNQ
jgi:hypothetical protein